MDVIIVVHTEFGYTSNRAVVYDKRAVKGVSRAVPDLIKIADCHGAKITFAVMPEVMEYLVRYYPKER